MASEAIVLRAFGVLRSCGFVSPDGMARDVEAAAAVWAAVLRDVSDHDLTRAVALWARGGSPWWPKPGELRALVAEREQPADAAWGHVLSLARLHPHGLPLDPAGRLPWRLSDDPDEEYARWSGVQAVASTWAGLVSLVSDSRAADGFRAAYDARATRAAFLSVSRTRLLGAQPNRWAEVADSGTAWVAVVRLAGQHGADDPPEPVGAPARFRLHDDPATEARLYSAVAALGGWQVVQAEAAQAQPSDAKAAAFRRAFEAGASVAALPERVTRRLAMR